MAKLEKLYGFIKDMYISKIIEKLEKEDEEYDELRELLVRNVKDVIIGFNV